MSGLRRYSWRLEITMRIRERNSLRERRRCLRQTTDLFSVSDAQFVELFRFPKAICKELFDEVQPHMVQRSVNGLPKLLRFLVALRFFAQGSYQRLVGQDFLLNVSHSIVSRCVKEIVNIMDKHLLTRYVKFPSSREEIQAVKEKFFHKFAFPGVIGAIDGCHIKIKDPGKDIEHVYVCRKGGHSINVQVVCDCDLKILDCNARFGGTAHDASVWRASALKVLLENKYSRGERNFWLLGDSGYPQLPFLMTPIQSSQPSRSEENYNRQHRKARNCIERCFGVLKSRFRCLLRERVLMYDPIIAGKIINTCIILHNIMILKNVGTIDITDVLLDGDESTRNQVVSTTQGIEARQQVVNSYF